MTLEEAKDVVRRRLQEREARFLAVLRQAVFSYSRSPYKALLDLARCGPGDVERLVCDKGLEGALDELRSAGVYVTFEEFKGRQPIVRHGREVLAGAHAFDNPLHSRAFRITTGGSTGHGSPVAVDLDHMWAGIPSRFINDTIHGFVGVPVALWFDGLPGNGPNSLITRVPYDAVPEKWFSPTSGRGTRPALKFRLAQSGMLAMARLAGTPLPWPEHVRLEDADVVARWAADALRRAGRCGLKTMVSRALRVALAAQELGIDLTGAVISGGGEPPTPAKVRAVRRTGARWISNYSMQEIGAIGCSCANPLDENDQHLLLDHLALITHSRAVPGFDVTVDAFQVTTLLPSARKIMLNVELDDYGVVETRRCGCPWEELGLRTHLREIRSFRKLTGEGMTLIGTDVVRILEEVLPARFGGTPLDYQLLEEEDSQGFTRLYILVNPHLPLRDEDEVVSAMLEALGRSGHAGAISRTIWAQAGTVRVRRAKPVWTNRGKLMPLHLQRTTSGAPQ
jgi:hypothetical protein